MKNGTPWHTPRQKEIAELLSQGLTNNQIALKVGTNSHVINVMTCVMYRRLDNQCGNPRVLLTRRVLLGHEVEETA